MVWQKIYSKQKTSLLMTSCDRYHGLFVTLMIQVLKRCWIMDYWSVKAYQSDTTCLTAVKYFLFMLNHGIKHLFHKALKWVITALYCPFRCYYYCDRKHFCVHDKVLSVLILLYCAQTYWQDEIFSLTGTIKVWVNS